MSQTKLDDLWERIKDKPLRVEGTLKSGKLIVARNISSVELDTDGTVPAIVFHGVPTFIHPVFASDRFLSISEQDIVNISEHGQMLLVQCKEKEVRIHFAPPNGERDVQAAVCPDRAC
jgi:hypothetical protein